MKKTAGALYDISFCKRGTYVVTTNITPAKYISEFVRLHLCVTWCYRKPLFLVIKGTRCLESDELVKRFEPVL